MYAPDVRWQVIATDEIGVYADHESENVISLKFSDGTRRAYPRNEIQLCEETPEEWYAWMLWQDFD